MEDPSTSAGGYLTTTEGPTGNLAGAGVGLESLVVADGRNQAAVGVPGTAGSGLGTQELLIDPGRASVPGFLGTETA